MPSTSGPLESGENDTERDNTLESVHVDRLERLSKPSKCVCEF